MASKRRLGKYRITRRIAEGGYATVYSAHDEIEGIPVALKVPHDQGKDHLAEFHREARLLAGLEHPNILGVKNASVEDGKFVLAYRLGEESLADRLTRRLAHKKALGICEDLLSAVAFAHSKRIVHRDIKPDNVILLADGRACLTDFGVARLSLKNRAPEFTGTGTLGYMAPEHAMGRPTFRSDVFSLGVVLWRILGGTTPEWPFDWPMEGHLRIRTNFGPDVLAVLKKALSVRERDRYADAGSMLAAFRRAKRRSPALLKRSRPQQKNGASSWRLQRERDFKRAAGPSAGTIVPCRSCKGPVAEVMDHCPWCGKSAVPYRGTTQFSRRCTRCHRGIKPDWKYCAWCYGGAMRDPSRRKSTDKAYAKVCRNAKCERKEALPFSRYCPWCRTGITRSWKLPGKSIPCSRCGCHTSPDAWDFCPWCGKNERRSGKVNRS